MKKGLLNYWNNWVNFWFKPVDLINISFFRLVFCGVLLLLYIFRFIDHELFFYDSGLLPEEMAVELIPQRLRPAFTFFWPGDAGMFWMNIAFLISLLLLALGAWGRPLAWLVFALHLGILQRNFSIVYGADLFATFWLFFLCFTKSDQYLSIKNLLFKKNAIPNMMSGPVTSMAIRLLQIQLCISYAYTGLEKLKGSTWWEGVSVWHVIGNSQIVWMDLSFLQHFPWIIAFLTFTTLLFEIYFPVMIWVPQMRKYWLVLGFGMHLFIAIFMGLPFFAFIMVSAYILFLKPDELRGFLAQISRRISPKSS